MRRSKWKRVAVAASTLMCVASAEAAAPKKPLSPFLTAAEYLAARGDDGGGDCLTATYAVALPRGDDAVSFVSCPTFLSMTLSGPDTPEFTTFFDFILERTHFVILEPGGVLTAKSYSTHSLAYVRRRLMDQSKLPAPSDALTIARLEAEHGLPFVGDSFVAFDRRRSNGGEAFFVGDVEYARVEYGDTISATLKGELVRALSAALIVHPSVAEAIANRGSLPKQLFRLNSASADNGGSAHYRLVGASIGPAEFRLPDAMKAFGAENLFGALSLKGSDTPQDALERALRDGPGPSFDDRLTEIESRLKDDDPLGAYVAAEVLKWTFEQDMRGCARTMETPRCARFRISIDAAAQSNDPDVVRYLKAKEAELRNAPEQGLAALDAIKPKDETTANRMQALLGMLLIRLRESSGKPKSDGAYWREIDEAFGATLVAEPTMTAVAYRYGADVLSRGTRLIPEIRAWILFDAARAMPHYRGGLADRVDSIERDNRRLMPYLFPETRQQQ